MLPFLDKDTWHPCKGPTIMSGSPWRWPYVWLVSSMHLVGAFYPFLLDTCGACCLLLNMLCCSVCQQPSRTVALSKQIQAFARCKSEQNRGVWPISTELRTCFWVLVRQQVSHCSHLFKTLALLSLSSLHLLAKKENNKSKWGHLFFPSSFSSQDSEVLQTILRWDQVASQLLF